MSATTAGAGDDRLAGVLAQRLRAAGTHTLTGSRTIIGNGPLNGGRSITVRERLLLPAAETRLEGGGGGNRSYVGLQMQIRGSRAQPETGGRL